VHASPCKTAGRGFLLLHNSIPVDFSLLQRNDKTNVLSDMLSDSIKYQDLRSEKHTYKSAIGSKRIKKLASLTVGSYTLFRQINFIDCRLSSA
jgi:hypothetical protein